VSDRIPPGVVTGNAGTDAAGDTWGWLVGHFVAPGDPRHSDAVEVKWGVHRAGDSWPTPAPGRRSTSLSTLVRGRFRLIFPAGEVLLANPGDYALWPPGVAHDWTAEEECVVLTVRWPSGDGGEAGPGEGDSDG
jgi:hypothetical protein